MDANIAQALENLAARRRQEQHIEEVEYTVEREQAGFSLKARQGVVLAVPPELAITALLQTYDTLTLGKKRPGKAKGFEAKYEVVARIGDGPKKTIVAFCS